MPLFPNRIIDPEKVENHQDLQLIIKDIKKWKSDIERLKGNAVKDIVDPYSMICFYIDYLYEKLADYLSKWNDKGE